jgi:hypothetical protein
MAKIIGGLHGRAAGNVGGIIYGAARSREGKVVTARELVVPANPQTGAQQNQRDKFKSSMMTVRALGPDTYQTDWNRAVGQLPGFHSMESILLGIITDGNAYETAPPDTPLGTLHFPDSAVWSSTVNTALHLTYSTENGDNGDAADEVFALAIQAQPEVDLDHPSYTNSIVPVRSGTSLNITGLEPDTAYLVCTWLTSVLLGTAHLSLARWDLASTIA